MSRPWAIVAAAAVANFVTFGSLFSFGVFLTPIARTFDTSTGPVAPLLSGSVLFYYLAGAVAGRLGDRYGIRPVVGVGAVALTVGLALSAAARSLWQLYLAYVPLVGIGVGCCYAPLIGAVGRWFDEYRTRATALLLIGVGAGTLVSPILGRELIDRYGWRTAYVVFATAAAIVLGVATVVVTEPRALVDRSSIPLANLIRSRRLVGLYLSVILIGPGFYAPLAFLNDYALDRGIDARLAAALVGSTGAASVAARLSLGVVGDRVGPLLLYRIGYGLLLGSLMIWLGAGASPWLLLAAAVAHGVGWAAWVTGTPVVLAAWFGTGDLGGILGLFYTGLGVGALLGPAISGFVIDRAGFTPAIAAVVVTNALAVAVALVSTAGADLTSLDDR